jgi:hypothetical protein
MRSRLHLRPSVERVPKGVGKESRKTWQCSFFYAKNLLANIDGINLLALRLGAPQERSNLKANPKRANKEMSAIVKRMVDLQEDGRMTVQDLLTTFISAGVAPLQRWSHKMCFMGSNRDPTRTSSMELSEE